MVDVRRLERALRDTVKGESRLDDGARAAYASDASNYRQVPLAVVLPRDKADVVAALAACRAHGATVLARGGGTAQSGQGVNTGVVIDCSKHLHRVLSVDAAARTARVEPGTVCDALRSAAELEGLTFAPDPATHSRCTLGGMIGNNSCGPHSLMAGKTVENTERLEVVTYDGVSFWCGETKEEELARIIQAGGRQGEIYARLKKIADKYGDLIRARFPKIKRRVSGYNLDQLLPENGFHVARALVGSEGTCALTLEAELKLVHSPRERVLLVLGFPDVFAAGDAVPRLLRCGPIACEGLDENIIGGLRERRLALEDIALLPPGKAWLMLEFAGASREEARARAQEALTGFSGVLIEERPRIARLWGIRETGASATALALGAKHPDPVVGWEDAAVDPQRMGDYLREFSALVSRFGYHTSIYGHFGDGCVHARIDFDLKTRAGIDHWRGFLAEAAALVVKYGGSLSGEHGDGQAKAEFLPVMFGPELMQAFREFKAAWDPLGRMNPGKLIDPRRADQDLRTEGWRPVEIATTMAFRAEIGDGFGRALERCIGMGKCRAEKGGTMCPSYRATREERYSTRGRARLLAEMLRGEVIRDGWSSEAVKEALEWCLACKGCASECPTHTDMASYKAEFLSHYYETHLRPPAAHAMGRIGAWAPLAARFPGIANALAPLGRALAGITPERKLPAFARSTFRSTFQARTKGERVILFDDTFNNHFRPQTALAAQRVLESAGCAVQLPQKHVCCGRPYYDFGMLAQARATLARALDVLQGDAPVVVLEPGCLSVFRRELGQLFPGDARAARLASRTRSLAEFLRERDFAAAGIAGELLLHGHCHQKALWGVKAEQALLGGADLKMPDAGCCGMAGSFGYRPQFYEASRAIAGLELLPALERSPHARVLADGFSCREQIEALSGRPTLHLAELLSASLR